MPLELLSHFEAGFETDFAPKSGHVNTIKGILFAFLEEPHDGDCGGVWYDWLDENLPNADALLDDLEEAGFTWLHHWAEGDYSLWLTDGGVAWAEQNLGLPKGICDWTGPVEAPLREFETYARGLTFARKGTHQSSSAHKGVRGTSKLVSQKGIHA
jgi:hypothetical protein